jgi:hypothetical protein
MVMLGRRSYERFSLVPPVEGALRVFQDVVLQRDAGGGLVAYGREAGVVGEVLAVDDAQACVEPGTPVRVTESHPVILQGAVRHRLRLEPVAASQS